MYFFLFVAVVYSHSWLECTKYTGNLEVFEKDKCEGLPRPLAGNRNVGNTFGADIGMDFRPQTGGARCQGNAATGTPGMVTYETGKTYTLAWPPKNHVAATCTNANIPDTFLRLYMTPYEAVRGDPDQDEFKKMPVKASFSDDPHVRGQMDFKGFMNCPKFCDDTDKSLCTGTFSVGQNVAPGVYTFQWYWAFNSAADLYATCWEANVVVGTGTPTGATGIQTTNAIPPPSSTTMLTAPPGCADCCDASDITAPGTGSMVPFSFMTKEETRWIDCPDGFTGQFKLFCLNQDVRLVDGFCNPSTLESNLAAPSSDDQSGTVAGLSVALAFMTLFFIAYVVYTREWVTYEMLFGDEKKDGAQAQKVDSWNEVTTQKRRAESVFTQSNTELPILPEAPANWYYVDQKQSQAGPFTQAQVVQYCRSIPKAEAQQTLVWNGETVKDWTAVNNIAILRQLVFDPAASV